MKEERQPSPAQQPFQEFIVAIGAGVALVLALMGITMLYRSEALSRFMMRGPWLASLVFGGGIDSGAEPVLITVGIVIDGMILAIPIWWVWT